MWHFDGSPFEFWSVIAAFAFLYLGSAPVVGLAVGAVCSVWRRGSVELGLLVGLAVGALGSGANVWWAMQGLPAAKRWYLYDVRDGATCCTTLDRVYSDVLLYAVPLAVAAVVPVLVCVALWWAGRRAE